MSWFVEEINVQSSRLQGASLSLNDRSAAFEYLTAPSPSQTFAPSQALIFPTRGSFVPNQANLTESAYPIRSA
jgi:hypothetical protein